MSQRQSKAIFCDFTLKNQRQRHNVSRFGSGSVSFCLPNHYGGASQQWLSVKNFGQGIRWKVLIYKNFFKVAGKTKMLANMPKGSAGRIFGQGLPPVKVTLNRMSRNGKDSNLKIKKVTKKLEFIYEFLLKKDASKLKTRVWDSWTKFDSSEEALQATQNKL